MSNLEESRIKCPKCGRMVPAMRYCIYCGTQLPAATHPTHLERPRPMETPPPLPPLVPPPARREAPPPQAAKAPAPFEREIDDLMSNISALYARKAALFKLFQSGEVSETVFLKLFNEYCSKLSQLLNTRIHRLEDIRKKIDEVERKMNEIILNLEELTVRYKVGEIDLGTFSEKSEKLKAEQKQLEAVMKSLKANLERLEKMLSDKTPKEIRDMENQMQSAYETIKKLVAEGKISNALLENIRIDVEETLAFLDSLIRDRKEKERILREQLETLYARYKIGEIAVEEYEKRKKEMQEEIDKIWS